MCRTKDKIKLEQGYKCAICLDVFPLDGLHIHHIKFRCQGGGDSRYNLCGLCKTHHKLLHRQPEVYTPIVQTYNEKLIESFKPYILGWEKVYSQ